MLLVMLMVWFGIFMTVTAARDQFAERARPPGRRTGRDQRADARHRRQGWLETDQLGTTRVIMQVHDELMLEVPESELVKVKLPELMAGVAALKVSLLAEVGIGKNRDEAY